MRELKNRVRNSNPAERPSTGLMPMSEASHPSKALLKAQDPCSNRKYSAITLARKPDGASSWMVTLKLIMHTTQENPANATAGTVK